MIRRPTFQYALLAVALTLYAWLAIYTVWQGINSNDFKHIFFGMKALLDGNSPYPIQSLHHQAALQGYQRMSFNPYVYLPFTGQAMAFLGPFRLDQAVAVWFVLNHLFLAGSVVIISRMFAQRRIGAIGILFISLAFSTPLYRTLTAGQLNLALLFLICLAWHFAHVRKWAWGGTVIAFASLFKLMPGIYGLYFLLRRQWLSLKALIIAGVAMLLASVLIAGPRLYLEFFPMLAQMGYGKSTWPHVFSFWDDPTNQSLNSFFSHILTRNDHTTPWILADQQTANLATIFATGALFLAYLYTLWRVRPRTAPSTFSPVDEGTWCSTLILALLVPSLLWDHYLVMLILPVGWMIRTAMHLRKPTSGLLVVACYLVTCIPWDFAAVPWRQGTGIILMSLKLWPTIGLFGLSLCFTKWSMENVSPAPTDAPESIEAINAKRENHR